MIRIAALALLLAGPAAAQAPLLTSPDGKVAISFGSNAVGQPTYAVSVMGRLTGGPSADSVTLRNILIVRYPAQVNP